MAPPSLTRVASPRSATNCSVASPRSATRYRSWTLGFKGPCASHYTMAEPELSLIKAIATNTQKLWGGENRYLKVAGGLSQVLQGSTGSL